MPESHCPSLQLPLTYSTGMYVNQVVNGFPLIFFGIIQNQREGQSGGKGLSTRIKRETKWVPELVFRIEEYEKNLIQLSRLTGVNLLRRAKNSTARDFKILNTREVDRTEAQEDDEREESDKGLTPEVSADDDSPSEEDGQELLQPRGNKKQHKVVMSSEDEEDAEC